MYIDSTIDFGVAYLNFFKRFLIHISGVVGVIKGFEWPLFHFRGLRSQHLSQFESFLSMADWRSTFF